MRHVRTNLVFIFEYPVEFYESSAAGAEEYMYLFPIAIAHVVVVAFGLELSTVALGLLVVDTFHVLAGL